MYLYLLIEHQPTLYGVDPPTILLLAVDVPAASPEFVEECEDDDAASPELGEEVSVPELDSTLDTKAPSVRRTVTLVTVDPAGGEVGPDTEVDVEGENVVSVSPLTLVVLPSVVVNVEVPDNVVEVEDDNDKVSGHCSAVTLPSSSPCSMKQNSSPFLV